MTILVADKLSQTGLDRLAAAGHEVISRPELTGDALQAALEQHNPSVLVVRSTKVPDYVLAAGADLQLVVRAGAGYDTIDVAGASARGVFVANCPGKNAVAVAELTMGLILSLDRRIPDNVSDARAGVWNKAAYAKAAGLKGRVLALIGMGNIGRAVARRAASFGMPVRAWSRSMTPQKADKWGVTWCESPADAVEGADIVSLHVAATDATRGLASRELFEAMKPGAMFINTTRSSVVDEDALVWALEEKGVRAGLDVFAEEPAAKTGEFESRIASHPSVYITHHIGASTAQAQEAIADEAVRVVLQFAETGEVPNCVNMAQRSDATHQLTVRHLDQVGVLASVLDQMRYADWNVQEMENLLFQGGEAACAHIRFHGKPNPEVLERIARHPDVLAISIVEL
ncbi:MAG: NAD(P)-binding domain-containing protein [Rhodothermales bacterium]|nr:NAD(P)-binding domain-containing protein [Rhodothermales bacterium]MBO6779687.1 NAD(P)-binding domain-containing protein [Rhodothermales bacterium]